MLCHRLVLLLICKCIAAAGQTTTCVNACWLQLPWDEYWGFERNSWLMSKVYVECSESTSRNESMRIIRAIGSDFAGIWILRGWRYVANFHREIGGSLPLSNEGWQCRRCHSITRIFTLNRVIRAFGQNQWAFHDVGRSVLFCLIRVVICPWHGPRSIHMRSNKLFQAPGKYDPSLPSLHTANCGLDRLTSP